jgi:hypothetical protein
MAPKVAHEVIHTWMDFETTVYVNRCKSKSRSEFQRGQARAESILPGWLPLPLA